MPSNAYAPPKAPAPVITDAMVNKAVSQVVAVLTALLLIRHVWKDLGLQPTPVLHAVEAMSTAELAAWCAVGAAAVWGLFSLSSLICSTVVSAFTGSSFWAKALVVVSVTALGTGAAAGNLFSGLVIAVAAAIMSGSLSRRGETDPKPHTLGS